MTTTAAAPVSGGEDEDDDSSVPATPEKSKVSAGEKSGTASFRLLRRSASMWKRRHGGAWDVLKHAPAVLEKIPSQWHSTDAGSNVSNSKVSELKLDHLHLRARLTHDALRNRLLWGVFIVAVSWRFLDMLVLDGIMGCCVSPLLPCGTGDPRVDGKDATCSDWYKLSSTSSYLLGVLVLTSDYLIRCFRLARRSAPQSNHWVAAASREFFAETVEAVRGTHEMLSSWVWVGGTLVLCAQAWHRADALVTCARNAADDPQCGELNTVCGTTNMTDPCHLAFLFESLINSTNLLWSLNIVATVILTPFFMWQPVMKEAIRRSGQRRLRRLLQLPWLALLPVLLLAASIGHSSRIDHIHPGLTAWELTFHFWFASVCATYTFSVALWGGVVAASVRPFARLLQQVYHFIRGSDPPGGGLSSRRTSWALTALPSRMSAARRTNEGPQAVRDAWTAQSMVSLRSSLSLWYRKEGKLRRMFKFINVKEASVRQLRCALLISSGIVWVGLPLGSSLGMELALWSLRLCSLFVLSLARDETTTFEQLAASSGPGMGLLVHRRDLYRVLKDLRAGKDMSLEPDVRRFKASAIRMQDALAISYRWQPEARPIGKSTNINMSDFQVDVLLHVLSKVSHLYVWLDILSVPQDPGLLKTTLLTRMMAVYCGAHLVLGIRTRESHLSRYHKRAWTLQEYCAAATVVMADECGDSDVAVTETSDNAAPDDIWTSATDDERGFFRGLRAEVQQDIANCRPFWLYGGFTDDVPGAEVEKFVQRYHQLSYLVHCTNEEDIIRALCPLLANVPVSSHRQLMELLHQAGERLGVDSFDATRERLLAAAISSSRPV